MVNSGSMTSSDWMLLALSNMGHGTQKKVGEAFVQRLLEKGDVHPAVAILLGLGEHNDAIEVYVSRKYHMEAVLLTCLTFPTDWQRQAFLARKWGEYAVAHGKAELAVRCFSCMGLETTEPWFSPRAQDAVFSAQKEAFIGSQLSPPLSPPSVGSSRVAARMASLKLVTDFTRGSQPKQIVPGDEARTPLHAGVTPIAESALTPAVGSKPWLDKRAPRDPSREPSSARTATPGAYSSRKRLPSRSDTTRSTTNNEILASLALPDRGQRGDGFPRTAVDNIGREAETLPFSTRRATTSSDPSVGVLSAVTFDPTKQETLPSPAAGVFEVLRDKRTKSRASSQSRNRQELHLEMTNAVVEHGLGTGYSDRLSASLSGPAINSAKARSIDQYISSLGEANHYAQNRTSSRNEERPASRTARARSRTREESQNRGRSGVRYIRPAKRSPSSPVPMSPEDAGIRTSVNKKEASTSTEDFDDERFYKVDIPVSESSASGRPNRSRVRGSSAKPRSSSKQARRAESPDTGARARSRGTSRASSRRAAADRGRSVTRGENSPLSPEPLPLEGMEVFIDHEPVRQRQSSKSRKAPSTLRESSRTRLNPRDVSPDSMTSGRSGLSQSRGSRRSRKELAARELEERRLSLARRPSAPVIPLPGDLTMRPVHHERSYTDDMLNPMPSYRDPIQRSQTAAPDFSKRYSPTNRMNLPATSSVSVPIGLPANPRAMRHPRYMTADPKETDDIPAVPTIPDNHMQESQVAPEDAVGPLLPATTFGQPVAPPRSMSAPPQDIQPVGLRHSPTYPIVTRRPSLGGSRGHGRQHSASEMSVPNYKRVSPPPITASIAETIHDSQVVIIEEDKHVPPVLSQLQHLATPPPPPPPPPMPHGGNPLGSVGMINVAIEGSSGEKSLDAVFNHPPVTGSSHSHRRGRGSVSENIGMTFKRVTERMRSTSRGPNHAKSPAISRTESAPYESVPDFAFPLVSRSEVAPYESVPDIPLPRSMTMESGGQEVKSDLIPPPPPPVPMPMEQVISPQNDNSQHFYKHPKEVRANMPPQLLQAGVYQGEPPMI